MNKPNVILIVLDTLRYDTFMKAIAGANDSALVQLAEDSVVFSHAIAPAPWTTPSHVSLLTGRYPSDHGVHESKEDKQSSPIMFKLLDYENELLTEKLRKGGYNTYGFVANPNLFPGSGFERGFKILQFCDMFHPILTKMDAFRKDIEVKWPSRKSEILDLANNYSRDRVMKFIKRPSNLSATPSLIRLYFSLFRQMKVSGYPALKGGDLVTSAFSNAFLEEPYFVFFNFMEAHDPYIVDRYNLFSGDGIKMLSYLAQETKISRRTILKYKKIYDNQIFLLETFISRIIDKLKQNGQYDRTVIIVTSDHGQSFGENNFYGHGIFLSNELIRIPMLIKFPNQVKFTPGRGYQSLLNLYGFIQGFLHGQIRPESLTSEVVFSQSFGIQEDYRKMFDSHPRIINKLSDYDKEQLCACLGDIKCILDISTGIVKFFDFESDREMNVTRFEADRLIDELRLFLGHKYKINIHQPLG